MQNVNASNFRKDMSNYFNQAIDYGSIISIATKQGNVVVMSEEEYRGLQETAYINSIPGLAQSIIEGAKTPSDELITIDWKNELRG